MYSKDKIILEQLTENDAEFFYDINSRLNFGDNPFLPGESPKEFTTRIISLCEFVFTIRLKDYPTIIVGECALHSWDKKTKEIEVGGSLYPDYWGKGLMQSAFDLLAAIAKQNLGAEILRGQTKTNNLAAIRLVEKMGFEKYRIDGDSIILRKRI